MSKFQNGTRLATDGKLWGRYCRCALLQCFTDCNVVVILAFLTRSFIGAFPGQNQHKMQSCVRTPGSALSNPFLGARMTYKTAVAPTPSQTANRQVATMARKKGIRLIVTIECTESRGEGLTPSRYVTQKNRKNTPERLELKKYNPALRRHTIHREIK